MPGSKRAIEDERARHTVLSMMLSDGVLYGGTAILCALLLLGGCTMFRGCPPSAENAETQASERMRPLWDVGEHVIALTNDHRREHGLQPLELNYELRELACHHSRDMIRRSFFDHQNPDGEAPSERAAQHHRKLVGLTGENIWKQSSERPITGSDPEALARTIVSGWMESPGHRKNILRERFTHLGVCTIQKGGELRVTQSFADAAGFFDNPLPKRMVPSTTHAVSLTPVSPSAPTPVRYDFWDPTAEERVTGPFAFEGEIRVPETEGRYRLRFHVPRDGGFFLASGPFVTVARGSDPVASEEPSDPSETSDDQPDTAPEVSVASASGDTATDFQADVIEASHDIPVLVDFWAPWCGPCRQLSPVLASLAEAQDGWTLEKVNVDERGRIAQKYDVGGLPTVTLFVDGKTKAEFTGAKSESAVRAWLAENVPSSSSAPPPTTASDTTQTPSPDTTSSGHVGW